MGLRVNVDTNLKNEKQDEIILNAALEKAKKMFTKDEKHIQAVVQKKPVVTFKPKVVIVTNKRLMIHNPTLFGHKFEDFLWKDMLNAHIEDKMFGSTIKFEIQDSGLYEVSHLPKDDAKKLYSFAQEKEEEWTEKRRLRDIEEMRASSGASQIMVNQTPNTNGNGIKEKLIELKSLCDEGLITQDEFEVRKQELLRMF